MGRWSQRRRRGGGGPGVSNQLARIVIASVDDPGDSDGTISVTFSANVTAASFTPALFSIFGHGAATSVVQGSPNNLVYSSAAWVGLGFVGDAWLFGDHVAGVVTPQSGLVA